VLSIVKKIEDTTNRSVVTAQSQQGPKPLSLDQPVAGKLLRWNGAEDGLENVSPSDVPLDTVLTQDLTITKATIAAAKADDDLVNHVGGYVRVAEYTAGNPIDALYEIVAGAGVDDGYLGHNSDTLLLFNLQLVDGESDLLTAGGVGDGATDNTSQIQAMAATGDYRYPAGTFKTGSLPDFAGKTVTSGNATLLIDSGSYSSVSGEINIIGTLSLVGEDFPAVSSTNVSNVDGVGKTFDIDVSSASSFVVGRFALVTLQDEFRGFYKVTAIVSNTLTLDGYHSKMVAGAVTCNVKPINTVITLSGDDGYAINGHIELLENIAIDAGGFDYGLIVGSEYTTGTRKPTGRITELKNSGVYNASRAGIIATMGGSIGVNGIGASKCAIGIGAMYASSVVGTGAYVNTSIDDCFKAESGSAMYITTVSATNSSTQSGFGSRYSSFMEMDTVYCSDVAIAFCIAQFNTYLSIRSMTSEGSGNYGLYATDSGHIVTNNNNMSDVSVNAVRAIQRSRVEGLGTNTFASTGNEREIQNSDVNYNGVFYSGRKVSGTTTVGTVNAGVRFATSPAVTGLKLVDDIKFNVSIKTDLPAGIIQHSAQTADDIIRIYFENVTAGNIVVGDVDYTIEY